MEVETKRFGVVAKSVLKRRVSNPVVASPGWTSRTGVVVDV